MENRFYLQALAVTGLFIVVLLLIWIASGGPASETQVRNAIATRTAIAKTEEYLLRPVPRTEIPAPLIPPTLDVRAGEHGSRPGGLPPSTPMDTPLPAQPSVTPVPAIPRSGAQTPEEFLRWYFARVWKERDYQNLWSNYLTDSFKTHVGSGLPEDYVSWWDSVKRVDVNSVNVVRDNGTDAWVRINLTITMKDGNILANQVYDYDLLYDKTRATWMFDYSP